MWIPRIFYEYVILVNGWEYWTFCGISKWNQSNGWDAKTDALASNINPFPYTLDFVIVNKVKKCKFGKTTNTILSLFMWKSLHPLCPFIVFNALLFVQFFEIIFLFSIHWIYFTHSMPKTSVIIGCSMAFAFFVSVKELQLK